MSVNVNVANIFSVIVNISRWHQILILSSTQDTPIIDTQPWGLCNEYINNECNRVAKFDGTTLGMAM